MKLERIMEGFTSIWGMLCKDLGEMKKLKRWEAFWQTRNAFWLIVYL